MQMLISGKIEIYLHESHNFNHKLALGIKRDTFSIDINNFNKYFKRFFTTNVFFFFDKPNISWATFVSLVYLLFS